MIVNAILTDHTFGITKGNVPYIIMDFKYRDEQSGEQKTLNTVPIFLVDGATETLQQSHMAEAILYIFIVFDALTWDSMIDKVVRIEVVDNTITKIMHPIDDIFVTIVDTNNSEPEVMNSNEMVETDSIEVME